MPVTAFYAGLCGLMLIVLTALVIRQRQKFQVGVGDGGHEELQRAIRVHGNFIENVPLALILLGLAESVGTVEPLLHAAGLALVVGRGLHAAGLGKSAGRTFGRFYGMILTWLALLVLIGLNVTALF